jgi:hypothetical protein
MARRTSVRRNAHVEDVAEVLRDGFGSVAVPSRRTADGRDVEGEPSAPGVRVRMAG